MNDAEQVKDRLDIVEVISGYVELKKAGKDYRGLSPFRQEKTASFFVSPDKQIWHDFGSSEGGDVISFVMRMEGLSFPEALEMLAARAGVKLSQRISSSGEQKSRLYEAVELACKFYHYQLSQSKPALAYIRDERGLSNEIIREFMIGYAPDSWQAFTDFAMKKGFTLKELQSAGLCGQRKQGQGGFDMFRDRIMFPVFDMQGRAVGFSARILHDKEKTAKYINTGDTPIYHKSKAIFGLKQAKESIRQSERVIIVEGNLDVISLYQHGVRNVVACSGTALTADQLKILSRMAEVIQLCFDQDEAGIKATQRAISLSQSLAAKLEVISYEGAKDPDELIRKDSSAWKAALDHSQYVVDYLFSYAQKKFGINAATSKKQVTAFMLPIIKQLDDRIEKEHYSKTLAQLIGVDVELIRTTLEKAEHPESPVSTNTVQKFAKGTSPRLSRQEKIETLLLELLLAFQQSRVVLGDIRLRDASERHKPIFRFLKTAPKSTLQAIASALPEQAEYVKMLALRGEHEYSHLSEHEIGLEAFTQVHNLIKHIVSQKKRNLTREIAQAESQSDSKKANELLLQYQKLTNTYKDL